MIDMLSSLYLMSAPSLEGFFDWFSGQAKWALYIVLIGLLIYAFFRQAWMFAVGMLIGLALVAFFVESPDSIIKLGEWLGGLIGLGGN